MRIVLFGLLLSACLAGEQDDIFYGMAKRVGGQQLENLLPPARDHNQPNICLKASVFFAASAAMSTNFNAKLLSKKPTNANLSAARLISCSLPEFNCNNDVTIEQAEKVLNYAVTDDVSDFSCTGYDISVLTVGKCTPEFKCRKYGHGESSFEDKKLEILNYHAYKLTQVNNLQLDRDVNMEQRKNTMRRFLNNDGALVCRIKHSTKLFDFTAKDLYTDYKETSDSPNIFLWVSLVGSITDGKDTLWIVQHSHGENVGFNGLLTLRDKEGKENPSSIKDVCFTLKINQDVKYKNNTETESIFTPRSETVAAPEEATIRAEDGDDKTIDYRAINGANYITAVRSQKSTQYCGSCWVQAATTLVADQLKINYMRKIAKLPSPDYRQFKPEYNFSAQSVINSRLAGSCYGGDSSNLYERMVAGYNLPIETCQEYVQKNLDPFVFPAQPLRVCQRFDGSGFVPVTNYAAAKLTPGMWRRVQGKEDIIQQLKNGPLTCSMAVTEKFLSYTQTDDKKRTIITEGDAYFEMNHEVEIVGYNNDQPDNDYWIIRNSWSAEYFDFGFFYVSAGKNLYGLESDCTALIDVVEPQISP